MRHLTAFVVLISLLMAQVPYSLASGKAVAVSIPQMDEHRRALFALNRLTFGPRPGDVTRVLNEGLDQWIDRQLHPERIDDSAMQVRLLPFRSLTMDAGEMVKEYPPPPVLKAEAAGKVPLPADPTQARLRQAQIARYEARQADKKNPSETTGSEADASPMEQLASLPPDERVPALMRLSPEQMQVAFATGEVNPSGSLMKGVTPEQRRQLLTITNPAAIPYQDLVQAKLLRAIYSERQLQEVMTDFWFNHFNVFSGKGADRSLLTDYERDVIRPRVFGKFEDLLVATAQSPAMLFYLDNWLSEGPNSDAALNIPKNASRKSRDRAERDPRNQNKKRNGLNENYARELMELHTLGVDGGYTQKDVTEVARVFTGWTLDKPNQGGGFHYDPRLHEPGDKRVLGHKIKSGGEKEGYEVLHLLTHQPSTANFISRELAERFVADHPPQPLVDAMAKTFLKKDGDIREVMKTMLASPEFWAAGNYRSKVKTPFEFVVSAVRASGAQVDDARPLAATLQRLGMPLYGMQAPTGYPMKADSWVNSAALLGRMNFALGLVSGKLQGTRFEVSTLVGDAGPNAADRLSRLELALLEGDASQQTTNAILAQLEDPPGGKSKLARTPPINLMAGLLIGSPEFQRR